jgi:uncharacterized protein (DUF1800 family)
MNPALRALNRFGLGARPGEAARLGDPRGWLEGQLEGGPPLLGDPAQPQRQALAQMVEGLPQGRAADPEVLQQLRQRANPIINSEMRAALAQRITSDRPFVERLVAFWSNHLCVSTAAAAPVQLVAGPYEREAIRPHVLGRFEDMVLASARHPAMLLYLDNSASIGPSSPAGRNAGRRPQARVRGLNENYARELLELHTLGVDGGYTQDDVLELARVLTGWSIGVGGDTDDPRTTREDLLVGGVGFAFYPNRHEPGARTVLGKRYAQPGVEQGVAVIRDLCAHPATARFVATKLVRHFVADDPPARAVDAVSAEFTRTRGDLRAVARALVALPEAWDEGNRKLRTPQDWLTASLRAVGAEEVPQNTRGALVALRQPLWAPPAPKGWGDTRAEWADPDSLMNRAELARTMANRAARGAARVQPTALLELVDVPATDPLRDVLSDASIGRPERIALALAGPAFQWR